MPNLINETQKILGRCKPASDLREQFYHLIKDPGFDVYSLGYFYQTHYKKFHNIAMMKNIASLLKKYLHISNDELNQYKDKTEFTNGDKLYLAINDRLNFNINKTLDLDWQLEEISSPKLTLAPRDYQGFFKGSVSDIDRKILSWVQDPYILSKYQLVSIDFWNNSKLVWDMVWKRYISQYFPNYQDDRPISGKEKFKEFFEVFKIFKSYYQNERIEITSEKFDLISLICAGYDPEMLKTLGLAEIRYRHLRAVEILLTLFKVKKDKEICFFNTEGTMRETYWNVTAFFMAGYCSKKFKEALYIDIGWLLLRSGLNYDARATYNSEYTLTAPIAHGKVSIIHTKNICSFGFVALINLAQAEKHISDDEFELAQNLLNEVSQSHKLLLGRYIEQVLETKRGFTLEYNDKQLSYLSNLKFALDAKNEYQDDKRIRGSETPSNRISGT